MLLMEFIKDVPRLEVDLKPARVSLPSTARRRLWDLGRSAEVILPIFWGITYFRYASVYEWYRGPHLNLFSYTQLGTV